MKFTLEIDCDNAAFGEGDGIQRIDEIEKILRRLGGHLYRNADVLGDLDSPLYDSNGNRVGFAKFERDKPPRDDIRDGGHPEPHTFSSIDRGK